MFVYFHKYLVFSILLSLKINCVKTAVFTENTQYIFWFQTQTLHSWQVNSEFCDCISS